MTYKSIIAAIFFFALVFPAGAQSLKAPSEFLGYQLGERFTHHYRVTDYYEHVGEQSDRVQVKEYGRTYEYRPLLLAYVSSPENLERLEEIRTDNLKRAGILPGQPEGEPVAVVWLSYNVHGNESVSTEAGMATLYHLGNPANEESQEWLKNTVVILDACLNPDGRERYVNFYNRVSGATYNPYPMAAEHMEPWPNGRANHYLFDLNRDWAWQTQKESKARLEEYNKWLPHVHADFHEQGINEPYYFAPAAEPFHEVITPFQREFQTRIGKNHARYFDENNWLYFTRERFDLFYPSYGDTYPTYNGAIGMTYEQGGSGRAGLGVITAEGDTLTLKDRIAHHHTAGLSTVEVTSKNSGEVLTEFERFYDEAVSNPAGKYKAYVIRGEENPDKVNMLTKWLGQQGIEYGYTTRGSRLSGFRYLTGQHNASFTTSDKDIVISAYQPKSTLLSVLFEPESKLVDSVTYDITAWAVPYAYGLDTYALTKRLDAQSTTGRDDTTKKIDLSQDAYAYLIPWQSLEDLKTLSHLLKEGVKVRYAERPFSIDGREYGRGTLIITSTGNESMGGKLATILTDHANETGQEIIPVTTGFVTSGSDFGSDRVRYMEKPSVALVAGDYVSSLAYGEVWHFFDQQIDYPVTTLYTDYISEVNLSDFDVLIMPNGYYGQFLNDEFKGKLKNWIREGGRLILMQNALSAFADEDGGALQSFASEEEKKRFEQKEKERSEKEILSKYEDRERQFIRNYIPGSIYKTRVDNTHPLAFGYPDTYFTLKLPGNNYAYLQDGWNVVSLQSASDKISGFSGSIASERLNQSLVFGVKEIGNGRIIYMADNPLFRAFWQNGKLLFGNAVFFVGQD
ncbi:M14 family metallopeptidase [Roseivirga sp. BDSF3-8]|uniref:M14 family metallopeptidase n=1 Tax=Roseivirga sp. BDSF3-8 TaxID=3241598 RepID=UPI00353215E9